MRKVTIAVVALVCASLLQEAVSQNAPKEQVGPLPGGGFLLNSGWKLHAAGEQVPVDTFPMSAAPSPDGKYLLVLNGGYNPPTISVIDIAKQRELGRTPLPDAWLGLAITPAGDRFYVGGGSSGKVYELSLAADGALARGREFAVGTSQAWVLRSLAMSHFHRTRACYTRQISMATASLRSICKRAR